MPDLPLAIDIIIVWLLASALVAFLLLTVGSRLRRRNKLSGDRREGEERRAEWGDRRVGRPDTREVRTERRSGQDRRLGERRGPPIQTA